MYQLVSIQQIICYSQGTWNNAKNANKRSVAQDDENKNLNFFY